MFIPLSMLLLFGCSARINENRVAFDGFMFNSKLKVGLNKKDFEITVLRANRSLSGAKEAGRYEATIYCVNKFAPYRQGVWGSVQREYVMGVKTPLTTK